MLDTSRKICTIFDSQDLSSANLSDAVRTIEYNPNKFYLVTEDVNIWEIIEQMSKESEDDNLVTRTRFAYNLIFELETVLTKGDLTGGTEVKTLAGLLELLEFDEGLILASKDFHVIINDDEYQGENSEPANRAVARLFQQMIFLNIDGLDIQKKSEINKAAITKRFRERYETLHEEITADAAFIEEQLTENENWSEESKTRAKDINEAFKEMLVEFEKAKTRPIRIAAMGTKKAGKSVIINSFLGHEYAPTSSMLPTPNTVKYLPEDILNLRLDYDGETYTFDTDNELHDFIEKEFKRAQREQGDNAALPDMIIHYPCPGLTGRYEIWDTPGPNYAGAGKSHEKIAEQCIRDTDICIFVMNYSNYLTHDEVNFLQKIHEAFKETGKFYSLLMTVNRIDERYPVAEAKSVDRILDYIGYKLVQLTPPYKNILVFGTSALQNHYLDKVIELAKSDGVTEEPFVDRKSIEELYDRHSKKFKTEIVFIEESLNKLRKFHDIMKPTDRELRNLSGVPQLWQYAQYIGTNKADMEIVDHVVGVCDTHFAKIMNEFLPLIMSDVQNLSDEDKRTLEEFAALIEGLKVYVDDAIAEVRRKIAENRLDTALIKADGTLQDRRRRAKQEALERGEQMLRDTTFTEDDVKAALVRSKTQRIDEFEEKISSMIKGINVESVEGLAPIQKITCDKYIDDVERILQDGQEKISRQTDVVKQKVEETIHNVTAQNTINNFKKPEFPPAIARLEATIDAIEMHMSDSSLRDAADDAKESKIETRTRTETRTKQRVVKKVREAEGFWENIRSFFGKTYYKDAIEDYEEPYEVTYQVVVDDYSVTKFKRSIAQKMEKDIERKIDSAHDKMDEDIKGIIRKAFANVEEQSDKICSGYQNVYSAFARDVKKATDYTEAHRAELEENLRGLTEIKDRLEEFIALWSEVRGVTGA